MSGNDSNFIINKDIGLACFFKKIHNIFYI